MTELTGHEIIEYLNIHTWTTLSHIYLGVKDIHTLCRPQAHLMSDLCSSGILGKAAQCLPFADSTLFWTFGNHAAAITQPNGLRTPFVGHTCSSAVGKLLYLR